MKSYESARSYLPNDPGDLVNRPFQVLLVLVLDDFIEPVYHCVVAFTAQYTVTDGTATLAVDVFAAPQLLSLGDN